LAERQQRCVDVVLRRGAGGDERERNVSGWKYWHEGRHEVERSSTERQRTTR